MTRYRDKLAERNVYVDLLAILFGIGSWIGINSVYLQLPLIVSNAPEGWSLPSYMAVVIQIGNIGPFTYTLFQKYSSKKLKDAYVIYVLFAIGCVTAIMMAFFYQQTAYVAGHERSVALLVLVFFFALVGCTSSVLFMPYMGRFREIYLITYLVGEGLSGFLTSIVTLAQGVGGVPQCIPTNSTDGPKFESFSTPPRFGTRVFFLFVFAMFVISAIAFVLLNKLKMCKREYAAGTVTDGNDYKYEKSKDIDITPTTDADEQGTPVTEDFKELSSLNYRFLMILQGVICLLGNGVIPGIQSYSCLPYGNTAYHLTVTLSAIANPVACFMAVFLPHQSIRQISTLAFLAALVFSYAFVTAVLSPLPPLIGTVEGEALIVSIYTELLLKTIYEQIYLFIGYNMDVTRWINQLHEVVYNQCVPIPGW